MGSAVSKDIPPYVTVNGNPARPCGINAEGLRRRSFDEEAIRQIKLGYRLLYKQQLKLDDALLQLEALAAESPVLRAYVEFLQISERSIVR
jgi:UDP-N-acetylglucosamine acyltransferase